MMGLGCSVDKDSLQLGQHSDSCRNDTIYRLIFLLANHISESTFQARCWGYEEQIEKSLKQTMAGEDEFHLIQTNFQQYKKGCSAH